MNVGEETNKFVDSDISNNDDLIAYPDIPTRPKCVSRTIHATGELAGNPSDTRRTRSQFESALCVKDSLFADKCYLIIEYDPYTYKYESYIQNRAPHKKLYVITPFKAWSGLQARCDPFQDFWIKGLG